MHSFLNHVAGFFFSLGGVGLLLLGMLDSSFLFLPLGNDLLIVALTAKRHEHWMYYVAMAAIGSTIGVAFTAWVSKKGGEKGLDQNRRMEYVKRKMEEHGGPALAVAALMPPPFPFTPFVIVTGALNYPLPRMLAIIAVCRTVRFTVEGLLAMHYGPRILQMAETPAIQYSIIGLVVVSMIGSAWSIWGWVKKSRRRPA